MDREAMLKLMSMMANEADDGPKASISAEGQIARLRETAALYAEPNKFRVGDFVTPRPGLNIRGAGNPHIVIDTILSTRPIFEVGEVGTAAYGKQLDMRVATIVDNDTMMFWVEHACFEPYTGPGINA